MIEQVSRDRGLDADVLIAAIEEALRAAALRYYGDGEELHSRFDRTRGVFQVYSRRKVVETPVDAAAEVSLADARKIDPEAAIDSTIEIVKDTEAIGRIAAQTCKHVISSRMRDVETENTYAEYSSKVGQVLHGSVKRFEGADIIVEFGRIEAILPKKEQNPYEHYEIGETIKVVVVRVSKDARGVLVIVSRADPSLLAWLLEGEVPEIRDRTVAIKGVVREAGERAKVAVSSSQRGIDPVGACVGVKGTRIQSIIRELRGERIDIIEWSQDPAEFVSAALNPAKVRRASVTDAAAKIMEVHVDEKQLSLAIGKRGQNVRLAYRLTGWRIDIKSEGEKLGGGLASVFPDDVPSQRIRIAKGATPPVSDGPTPMSVPDSDSAPRRGRRHKEVDKRTRKEEKSLFAE